MRTRSLSCVALTLTFVGQLSLADSTPAPPPHVPAADGPTVLHLNREVRHLAAPAVDHLEVLTAPEPVAGIHHLPAVRRHVRLLAQAAPAEDVVTIEHAGAPQLPPVALQSEGGFGMTWAGADWAGENFFGPDTGEPLVIPKSDPDAAELAETREDLSIMSRILNKAAGRTGERGEAMALGIALSSVPGIHRARPMYLEGYGAVFTLQVPFPLAPGEEAKGKGEEPPSNTAWEEARRELYGPSRTAGAGWIERKELSRTPFDADRVERLKGELTDALKHAGNLRHVKDEESVVVVVSSGSSFPHEMRIVRLESRGPKTGKEDRKEVVASRQGIRASGASTLVFRVKKADAADYAGGKLDRDAFAKRVAVTSY